MRYVASLRRGEKAKIRGIRGTALSSKRLADLGFVNESTVEMLMPGSTCIVRINGTVLALGTGYQTVVELLTGESLATSAVA